jgi:hypothetical protein
MMTIKATSTTVHERKHRVIIPHKALERAIAEEAARAVQFDKLKKNTGNLAPITTDSV